MRSQIEGLITIKSKYWNKPIFKVYDDNRLLASFIRAADAFHYVSRGIGYRIVYRSLEQIIWKTETPQFPSALLDVPLILQLPELPRGCEVTALAMILQYYHIHADKEQLANEVRRDYTPYRKMNGVVYFGNPYDGFVGDMYSFSEPGLGVYHGPIAELAEQYAPNRILDVTGVRFEQLYYYIDQGIPLWVINNVMYEELPAPYWETWHTPSGEIQITMQEHAMVIVGYDTEFIYFKDPLNRQTRADKLGFIRGWEQLGKQAIVVMPEAVLR